MLSGDLCILAVAEVTLEKVYTIVAFGFAQLLFAIRPPVEPNMVESDAAAIADPVVEPVPLKYPALVAVTVTVALAPDDKPDTVNGYEDPDAVPSVSVPVETAKE